MSTTSFDINSFNPSNKESLYALKEAIASIYFNDSSKHKYALYSIIRALLSDKIWDDMKYDLWDDKVIEQIFLETHPDIKQEHLEYKKDSN